MNNKIVFIAHSYHKKTHSYDFIVDYLKNFYDVEILFDEKWETGKEINWSAFDDNYKAIVIFQMFPDEKDFKKIKNENIIYMPMYDHVEKWHFKKWHACKNIKIVNFSYSLHKKLKKWGFNSIYVQFFIEPQEFSPGSENEAFFWQRLTKININTIKKIFKDSNIKIHIHKSVDPGQEFIKPAKNDEERFKITYSDWFDTKTEMQEFTKNMGIYISSRFMEGIGMGFLEALAQGKLIIANDKPTMNEYIKHGKTGYLCNFRFPRPAKFSNIREIQKNAYNYAKDGYKKWLIERVNIINFINEPPQKTELKLWTRIFLPFLFFNIREIIRFKFGKSASLYLFGIKIFQNQLKD